MTAMPSLTEISAWFEARGGTDTGYLEVSYARFARSFEFVNARIPPKALIADIGTHWLHQASFFALAGHKIEGFDVPATITNPLLRKQAKDMGVGLHLIGNLETGDGLKDIPDSTFDAVLFFEIIEHIAFNPVLMWKEIYRVLKPGGKLFISTPNSMHHEILLERLVALEREFAYGAPVEQVLTYGTYGHHWKEYSPLEMKQYFKSFAPALELTDALFYPDRDPEEERWRYEHHLTTNRPKLVDFPALVTQLELRGGHPFERQMIFEITAALDKRPIELTPPW